MRDGVVLAGGGRGSQLAQVAVHPQQQQAEASPAADTAQEKKADDDVVDAEFSEVDDSRKA